MRLLACSVQSSRSRRQFTRRRSWKSSWSLSLSTIESPRSSQTSISRKTRLTIRRNRPDVSFKVVFNIRLGKIIDSKFFFIPIRPGLVVTRLCVAKQNFPSRTPDICVNRIVTRIRVVNDHRSDRSRSLINSHLRRENSWSDARLTRYTTWYLNGLRLYGGTYYFYAALIDAVNASAPAG